MLIISASPDWLKHVSVAVVRVGSPASEKKKLGCWPVGCFWLFPPKTSPVPESLLSLAPEILSTSPFPFPYLYLTIDPIRYDIIPSHLAATLP